MKNAKHRCRKCGKEDALPEWKHLHEQKNKIKECGWQKGLGHQPGPFEQLF
jgi:hypothetical protein